MRAFTGGRGGLTQGVNWGFFDDLFFTSLSINPVGKVRAYSKKAHQFDLNKPSGQIEKLIKENPPTYLWATLWKYPWVSFINLFKISPQYTWATHQRFFHNFLRNIITICSGICSMSLLRVYGEIGLNWEFIVDILWKTQWICCWAYSE